jgi:hypothetical protein
MIFLLSKCYFGTLLFVSLKFYKLYIYFGYFTGFNTEEFLLFMFISWFAFCELFVFLFEFVITVVVVVFVVIVLVDGLILLEVVIFVFVF